MPKISKVIARQVFDSRGNPTIETEVFVKDISASAICPSGASTGTYEAFEKRDNSNKKYLGKSVLKPVEFINKVISNKLKNFNVHQQEKIDNLLIRLDGTKQKKRVGANAILSVSIAVKKLSSKIKKIPIYKNLIINKNFKLPYPLMNIINGGAHANNGLRIQEFMIRPDKAKSFSEGVRMCFIVINKLRLLIKKMGHSTSVGDEGGFAPMINDNESALKLIVKAINLSGFKNGKDIVICLDVAANELLKNKKYSIHSEKYTSVDKSIENYLRLVKKYKIMSIEDPFGENDWSAWAKLLNKTKNKLQIVGDDLFVTNLERLKIGFLNISANSILIKLNQIGTVTETLEVIKFAKLIGYKTIISHRSGDSEDTFIADFAVGTDSNQIKTGSLARSERVSKYNQLLRIEQELGKKSKMHSLN
ncbi:phosphopyruvate hydratase [Candidatus Pelagibacter sp.]|nr:phosphopyruvate hydratase [Candidatus Pelagibacter sp.]